MDDALLVRGLERVRDLPRDGDSAGVRRGRAAPRASRSASVSPSTSSSTSARMPPLLRRRRSRRCADDSARRACGPRARSARAVRVGGERRRQDLDRHVATERASRARYTSPMPPAPSSEWTRYDPKRRPTERPAAWSQATAMSPATPRRLSRNPGARRLREQRLHLAPQHRRRRRRPSPRNARALAGAVRQRRVTDLLDPPPALGVMAARLLAAPAAARAWPASSRA